MQHNLVIVESPAKAKTLEKFLGPDFKVLSSYGHIRDLKKHAFSVNTDDFTAQYEIPTEKADIVKSLRAAAKKADTVWLASDEDREGEAISWHLAQVLDLDIATTRRIVFHEITKTAILEAIDHPRTIDLHLVDAQQARRVLDRIVGFKLSPVLWRRLRPSLSAGRVQSVALRLIVEREREVEAYEETSAYRVTAEFAPRGAGSGAAPLKAELNHRFATEQEAGDFLASCRGRQFAITDITRRPGTRTPAPPFTTSTLQQEAARKLGFSVSQTMSVAQRLYEAGNITYMRTDSVNLSSLCLGAARREIEASLGAEYAKTRQYHTHSKGAQEAHEAIRPAYMDRHDIEGTPQERRLYQLIWKRTIACQMADAQLERTTVTIAADGGQADSARQFAATAEVVKFDGFLRVYAESSGDDSDTAESAPALTADDLAAGQELEARVIEATERFSQRPPRYTEASLVHRLEELGIGRPSTYAPTISTIQQRGYVAKGDRPGTPRAYRHLALALPEGAITAETREENTGNERGKLLPTDTGTVVTDFLVEKFPDVFDYNFTANVEKDFDAIAEGQADWQAMMSDFYHRLDPQVDAVMHEKSDHRVGERVLGTDPVSGRQVSVKISRFGPVAQIGKAQDEEKPRFANLRDGQSIQTITLDEALALFQLPRTLGVIEDEEITVSTGRFGPYVRQGKLYASLPKGEDPMSVTIETAVELLQAKREAEAKRHIKTFDEEPELEVLNGRWGPYLLYKGSNYKIPKTVEAPAELTLPQCLDIIKAQEGKPKTTRRRAAKK